MRTNRLETGHFKKAGDVLPSRSLRWRNSIWRPTGVLTNTVWFSLDNATGMASMVNQNDVDGGVLWQLGGYLDGDEVVAIVTEHSFHKYCEARQWHPTEADGPLYQRPPGVILGGDIDTCSLQIPLADAVGMAAFLVVAQRAYVLRPDYDLGNGRLEVVPPDAIPGLLADT